MIKIIKICSLVVFLSIFLLAKSPVDISYNELNLIETKYGIDAKKRVLLWDEMLQKAKKQNTLNKLKTVNDFFNQVGYKKDNINWEKTDHWATLFEFLGTGVGDCEDYAISKYFTLRKLQIPAKKLRISFVKLSHKNRKSLIENHMVLNYYHTPSSTPVVLDNVNKKLKLSTSRDDLKYIYSFNETSLWKVKNKGKTQIKLGTNNLKKWKNLIKRIQSNF